MPGRRARRLSERRAGGYTLIELLIVVAILAIIGSISMLSGGTGDAQALELTEVQVRDAVQWAQAVARSTRTPHGVNFDTTDDRLAVVTTSGQPIEDPLTKAEYIIEFTRPNQPTRIEITSADFGASGATLLFDAQGVPLTGGTVVIERGSLSTTLTVNAATGRVTSS